MFFLLAGRQIKKERNHQTKRDRSHIQMTAANNPICVSAACQQARLSVSQGAKYCGWTSPKESSHTKIYLESQLKTNAPVALHISVEHRSPEAAPLDFTSINGEPSTTATGVVVATDKDAVVVETLTAPFNAVPMESAYEVLELAAMKPHVSIGRTETVLEPQA